MGKSGKSWSDDSKNRFFTLFQRIDVNNATRRQEPNAVLQGTKELSLDSKGRLAIPTRDREVWEAVTHGRVIVTRHPDGCLLLYPEEVWNEKRALLMKLDFNARHLVRMVLGSATPLEWDRQGRFLIPVTLRNMAGLTHEVHLVGLGDHAELWDPERLAALEKVATFEAQGWTF